VFCEVKAARISVGGVGMVHAETVFGKCAVLLGAAYTVADKKLEHLERGKFDLQDHPLIVSRTPNREFCSLQRIERLVMEEDERCWCFVLESDRRGVRPKYF